MFSFTLDKGHIVTAEFLCASIMLVFQVSFITFSTACYGLRIKRMVTSYKTHIHLGLEWDAVNWCLVCPPTLLWLVKYLQKWKWTICDLRQWKDHVSVLASPSTLRTRYPKWSYEEQSHPTFPHSYDQMKKELMESNPFFLWKKYYLSKVILWSSFNGIPRSFRNRCFNRCCLQPRLIPVGAVIWQCWRHRVSL